MSIKTNSILLFFNLLYSYFTGNSDRIEIYTKKIILLINYFTLPLTFKINILNILKANLHLTIHPLRN